MTTLRTVLFLLAGLLVSASAAAAPPRSFDVARDKLPADTVALASVNGKTVRATQLFTKLFAKLVKEDRDTREAVDLIKKTCGIDPVNVVDDVTVGIGSKDQKSVYVAFNGVTEAKATACVKAAVKKEEGIDLVASKKGDIVELKGPKDSVFFAWLAGDVLVVADDADDRAALERSLSGGFAKGKLASRVSRLATDAAAFGTWNKKMSEGSITVNAGDFAVLANAGKITARANLETASAKDAEQAAAALKLLSAMVPKGAPKAVSNLAKSVTAKATGADVAIEAQGTETDILTAVEWILAGKPSSKSPPPPPG